MKGTVRNLVSKRQFAFIHGEDNVDYFFHRDDFNGHWSDLENDITTSAIPVEFDIAAPTAKGPRAANVRRIDFPNQVG